MWSINYAITDNIEQGQVSGTLTRAERGTQAVQQILVEARSLPQQRQVHSAQSQT